MVPAYRGESLTAGESRELGCYSLALPHPPRASLWHDLRTKQQLGYIIVGSYHGDFSSRRRGMIALGAQSGFQYPRH
jgi:secreted Zn-dependent insulinase-like peptidase